MFGEFIFVTYLAGFSETFLVLVLVSRPELPRLGLGSVNGFIECSIWRVRWGVNFNLVVQSY